MLKCVLNTDPIKRYNIEDIRRHTWYQMVMDIRPEGVIMGQNSVPIDEEVFKCLEEYGFNPEYGRKCLESNKHNHITTTY
jgi:5'-AMP-activated protein kinase catalytic alpha subunit